MSGEGLVDLARRYVRLSDELEGVRGEIRKAVLNGAGGMGGEPVRPTHAERPGVKRSQPSQHPNAIAAQQAEARIIELLKQQPGMKTTELAKATGAKVNTTTQRLQRMHAKGLIERDGDSGWTGSA